MSYRQLLSDYESVVRRLNGIARLNRGVTIDFDGSNARADSGCSGAHEFLRLYVESSSLCKNLCSAIKSSGIQLRRPTGSLAVFNRLRGSITLQEVADYARLVLDEILSDLPAEGSAAAVSGSGRTRDNMLQEECGWFGANVYTKPPYTPAPPPPPSSIPPAPNVPPDPKIPPSPNVLPW